MSDTNDCSGFDCHTPHELFLFTYSGTPATTGGNKHGRQDWFWWLLTFMLLTFFTWRVSL